MSTTTWTIADIFNDPNEDHDCCSCCAGWCPRPDHGHEDIFGLHVVGEFITNRYVAVRADRLTDRPTDLPDITNVKNRAVLDAEPPALAGESTRHFTPSKAAPLLRSGITIGEGGEGNQQPLYEGGEHVGWIMPARGAEWSDLASVRRYMALIDRLDALPRGQQVSGVAAQLMWSMRGSFLDRLALAERAGVDLTRLEWPS